MPTNPLAGSEDVLNPQRPYDEKTAFNLFVKYLKSDRRRRDAFSTQFIDWLLDDTHDVENFDEINISAFQSLLQKPVQDVIPYLDYIANDEEEIAELVNEYRDLAQQNAPTEERLGYLDDEEDATVRQQAIEYIRELRAQEAQDAGDVLISDVTFAEVLQMKDRGLYSKVDPDNPLYAERYSKVSRTKVTEGVDLDETIEIPSETRGIVNQFTFRDWFEENITIESLKKSNTKYEWDLGRNYYPGATKYVIPKTGEQGSFTVTVDVDRNVPPLAFEDEIDIVTDIITKINHRKAKLQDKFKLVERNIKKMLSDEFIIDELNIKISTVLGSEEVIDIKSYLENLNKIFTESSQKRITNFTDITTARRSNVEPNKAERIKIMQALADFDLERKTMLGGGLSSGKANKKGAVAGPNQRKPYQSFRNFMKQVSSLFDYEGIEIDSDEMEKPELLDIYQDEKERAFYIKALELARKSDNPANMKAVTDLLKKLRKELREQPYVRTGMGEDRYLQVIYNTVSKSPISPQFGGFFRLKIHPESITIKFVASHEYRPELGTGAKLVGGEKSKQIIPSQKVFSDKRKTILGQAVRASAVKQINKIRARLLVLNKLYLRDFDTGEEE